VSTLAESWNGSAWAIQPTPDPSATQGSTLSAVSCTSATSCTAVGQYQSSNVTNFGALQTLAEVWDGTTWSLESAPNPSPAHDLLSGVSCGASQVCTAVGQAQDAGGIGSTLIETGFTLLTGRGRTLQHVTASPGKTGGIARAALVLTHFEHGYIA
jgi:hypothetical protein